MNLQNSLVPFVLLFLLFFIILPCNSAPSGSRRKSKGGRDVEKYGERRERRGDAQGDGRSRRSSGHRAQSDQRRKSDRRRREHPDEDGERLAAAGDKYKYNRHYDEGTSRRDENSRRPSRNRETRDRPTERGRKSHGKQVDVSENYEQRNSRTERRSGSKTRDGRKSGGGRDGHHGRRSRHERDGHDDGKRRGGNGGEGRRHRHSSGHREGRQGDRSQARQEHKSSQQVSSSAAGGGSKSDAHKSKMKDYDEKTMPFLSRYAQQQSDNKQPSSSKSVEQPKNDERQKSTGSREEKKQPSGNRKSNNKNRRRSNSRPKSSNGQRQRSSGGGGNRGEEGRLASAGGGRVGVRIGRPVAIGQVVAADAKPKQSELDKAWRKELKVRYKHPIKHVFVEGEEKVASEAKPDKRAIKEINYTIPVNVLYDKQKVLDEMDQIIGEMVEMAAFSRINSEDPDLDTEQKDDFITASIDAKETAQIAYAYKTIIQYCYPELEKMYNNVDAQLKSRRSELMKLERNISKETEKVVKSYVWLNNKIGEASQSIEKGVRTRHQKKLHRLNSEMDMLGDMSQADNVRTADLSVRINETVNAIEKVEAEIRHEEKLIKEMEENTRVDQKRMAEMKKQIEAMQERNSFVQTYLDMLIEINKLAAEKADLSSSLSDLRLDRSYVDRARDIIDAPRDMLRQRKTRQVAAEGETWEEALAAERPKRTLHTMFKNITEENGTNHYAVFLAQVFTEKDKAALKKIIKDRINAEYKRMKEEAEAERSKSDKSRRSQSRSVASSKSEASRSLRLGRAD